MVTLMHLSLYEGHLSTETPDCVQHVSPVFFLGWQYEINYSRTWLESTCMV